MVRPPIPFLPGGFMQAERWFQGELALINKHYFAAWNSRKHRWQIRAWKRGARPDFRWPYREERSTVIMTVCHMDGTRDVGFMPLDQRTLFAVKKSVRDSENPEWLLREVDESNARLEDSFDKENKLIAKELTTSVDNHFHSHTVDLGA